MGYSCCTPVPCASQPSARSPEQVRPPSRLPDCGGTQHPALLVACPSSRHRTAYRADGGCDPDRARMRTVDGPRLVADARVRARLHGVTPAPSRLVLGTSGFRDYDTAAAILDAWFEAGCNTLDTAWIYGVHRGDLPAETIVGRWIRTRGVEADVVVFGKAAHPPECRPECLPAQVEQSLDRLGLARMHMVQAHRDDTSIPVGEWAEALIALVDCGLAASYGVSNWTIERLQAIYEYADARQQLRPAGVSDQLSLAEMVIPIYEGCVSLRGQDQ